MTRFIPSFDEMVFTPVVECIQVEVIPGWDTFGENLEGWWTEIVGYNGKLVETEWTESDASQDKDAENAFLYHRGLLPPIRRFTSPSEVRL